MISLAIIDRRPFRPHLASPPPRWRRRRRRRLMRRSGRGSPPPPPPAEVAIPAVHVPVAVQAVQHVTAVAVQLGRCSRRHPQAARPTSHRRPRLEAQATDAAPAPCFLAVQHLAPPSRLDAQATDAAPPCWCVAVQHPAPPSGAVRPLAAFVPLHTPPGEAALSPLLLAAAPLQGACLPDAARLPS